MILTKGDDKKVEGVDVAKFSTQTLTTTMPSADLKKLIDELERARCQEEKEAIRREAMADEERRRNAMAEEEEGLRKMVLAAVEEERAAEAKRQQRTRTECHGRPSCRRRPRKTHGWLFRISCPRRALPQSLTVLLQTRHERLYLCVILQICRQK